MSKKDLRKLNKDARRNRKGHPLSKHAVYKLSQTRRRSLY